MYFFPQGGEYKIELWDEQMSHYVQALFTYLRGVCIVQVCIVFL